MMQGNDESAPALSAELCQAYFKTLFDSCCEGLLLLDAQGHIQELNPVIQKLWGEPHGALLGQSLSHLLSDSQRPHIEHALTATLEQGHHLFEAFGLRADGTTIPVEFNLRRVAHNGENLLLCTVRDISQRRQQLQELHRLQFAIEHMSDGMFWLDNDGRVIHANQAACRSLGYTLDELLRLKVSDFDPQINLLAWPQHRQTVRARKHFKFETVHCHKSGRVFPVEVTVNHLMFNGQEYDCAFVRDITAQKRTEAALRTSESHYRELVEDARSIILRWKPDGTILFINHYAEELLGFRPEELIGRPVLGTIVPRTESSDRDLAQLMQDICHDPDMHRLSTNENLCKNGDRVWMQWTNRPIFDDDGNVAELLSIGNDITSQRLMQNELRKAYELLQEQQTQLMEQSIRDAMTGVFNRRYFDETLKRELARCVREGTELSLVMLDVDHFKQVNDAHGHQVGDEVLKNLAKLLQQQTRAEDVVCRYGGEEFLVILPGTSLAHASERAESWRKAFADLKHECFGKSLQCTISLGIASHSNGVQDCDALLRLADRALYKAKTAGRNRSVSVAKDSLEATGKFRRLAG